MPRRCHVCGKGPIAGSAISHSGKHSKRTWIPNLQPVNAIVGGRKKKIQVCTRCIKAGKVTRAS